MVTANQVEAALEIGVGFISFVGGTLALATGNIVTTGPAYGLTGLLWHNAIGHLKST